MEKITPTKEQSVQASESPSTSREAQSEKFDSVLGVSKGDPKDFSRKARKTSSPDSDEISRAALLLPMHVPRKLEMSLSKEKTDAAFKFHLKGESSTPWSPMLPDEGKNGKNSPSERKPSSHEVVETYRSQPSASNEALTEGLDFSASLQMMQARALEAPKGLVEQPVPLPQALLEQVSGLIARGGGKMTIQLNPEELGRVEIEITARGNKIEVAMKSEMHSTKEILESQVEDLKRGLQSQDLSVAKLDIRHDQALALRESSLQFSFTSGGFDNTKHDSRPDNPGEGPEPLKSPKQPIQAAAVVAPGRVDIRI